VLQGSVVDTGQAGWVLETGVADAVEMTRAQIADAELVTKLASGVPEQIRPCVLCNQQCQVRDNRNPIVSCVADPSAGHETADPSLDGVALSPEPVTIVGAGPAGLEAARVAAQRGHHVRLIESTSRTGGMVRTAAEGFGRDRLALLVDWLLAECERLGVKITFNVSASAESLIDAGRVILATGGQTGVRSFHATPSAIVFTAAEVLSDTSVLPDGAVLIWDPIGGPIGVSVAELLAATGREVHLGTQDNIIGNELSRSGDLAPANARLQQAGVKLHRRNILRRVTAKGAELEDRFDHARVTVPVVAVIDAGHRLPNDRLWNELSEHPEVQVWRAGDAVAPRTILEAILEGRRVALELG
jgi:hypothetical protein